MSYIKQKYMWNVKNHLNFQSKKKLSEINTTGGETSHDGLWGAKPHSRTRRDHSFGGN